VELNSRLNCLFIMMKSINEIVFIVDDERSVRTALSLFLAAAGYKVEDFGSSEEYLIREPFDGIGCLILDVNMKGKTGLELQEELLKLDSHLPVIFITGYADIHMSVNALKKGAVNFLEKPFKDEELLQSVAEALTLSQKLKTEKEEMLKARDLVGTLTPREHEILTFILTGKLNKQIAAELNIKEHTVKIHRGKICEKFGVKSVPEIIRISDKAGIIPFRKNSE
jgi:FixJ family two-component response regulator